MTTIYGNSGNGGTTGLDGSRVVVTYSYTQNIAGNYTDVAWSHGIDYGDPNYWTNVSNRYVEWSVNVGSSVAYVSGNGNPSTNGSTINTSDPGYGGQVHYFWSGTVRIFHNSSGQGTIHLAATADFHSSAYTSSISSNIALPDIVQSPTAPGAPAATRVNDGQINLAWTNNSSSHHAYASQKVQRSVDGGAYSTIASGLSGSATAYSDTATTANHKYAYKVQAVNAAGSATSGAGSAVYTTPAADSDVTATKLAGGDVQVTWVINANYSGSGELQHDVYDNPDGGGWVYLATVSGPGTSYTHVAPNAAQTHQYHTVAFPTGTSLYSQSNDSNVVTLLATAGVPTGLSPSGVARDAADVITLAWTHNPTDGTPQSKRHVQYKVNAGSYADLVNDSSTTSSYDIAAATLTNGDTITWKVATAGENGTLGSYSAEASFTLSAKPTATINAPDATYDTSSLTVDWGYFQDQSSAQAAWQASLLDDAGFTLEALSGTTETTATFAHTVADGESYTVTVTVTSAAGLASTAASQAFTVTYGLPAAVTVAGAFDNAAGTVVLTLTGGAAAPGYSGLTLDGTGDYASTPDAAALDITGDIDIRLDVELTDWTPAADMTLLSKWVGSGGQRSYEVYLSTSGALKFRLSTDGGSVAVATATSSANPTPVGGRLSLRVDRNSGVVTFYTSADTDLTAATWTQLGTTQAAAGTMFSSTGEVHIGRDGGALADTAGTVFSAEIRNSADTVVANPYFTLQTAGATSFTDGAGLTWTLNGSAALVTVGPSQQDIATVDVQRQIDGGAWVTILSGVVLDALAHTATVQDTVPATVGTNTYRAIAYSALPSSLTSATADVVTSETTWGYLSGGDSFADVARFRAMPAYAASASRDKALYHFAGRAKPVQLAGEALTSTLSVSGKLSADSGSAADFEALGQAQGVHCWRGPDGRRLFASLGKVDTGTTRLHGQATVSFTLTEVDFSEGDQ